MPYKIIVEKDRDYYLCACGKSKKQPLCDGAHRGGQIVPTLMKAEEDGETYLCGCGHSKNKPYCDGSHTALTS